MSISLILLLIAVLLMVFAKEWVSETENIKTISSTMPTRPSGSSQSPSPGTDFSGPLEKGLKESSGKISPSPAPLKHSNRETVPRPLPNQITGRKVSIVEAPVPGDESEAQGRNPLQRVPMIFARNTSSVVQEGGAPKLMLNGRIVNNMFGIDVYTSGMDPAKPQFLVDMKKVIDRAGSLGIPLLTFDILWNDYDRSTTIPLNDEEAVSRFDTATLDAVLDYAYANNIHVILDLATHIHWALPNWWRQYGNNNSGFQLIGPPTAKNESYNVLQSPVASFGSSTHRKLAASLIERLVTRYRNHPAVAGWGINVGPTGENGYAPNYIDLLWNPSLPRINLRTTMADYSNVARDNFRRWLENKYYGIGALNREWNSRFSSFWQVSPPYPKEISAAETFRNNGDDRIAMQYWQSFRHEAIVGEWKFLSDTVRRLDPDKLIVGKTNWNPLSSQIGSEFMLASAAAVNSLKLINADKMCGGLTPRDYSRQFVGSSADSKLDHYILSRFSKEYNTMRVLMFENWFMTEGSLVPDLPMDYDRALSVKEQAKKEGCYFWFAVALDSDTFPKPAWKWEEVATVVGKSRPDELRGVKIQKPAILFYFDVDNLYSHYYSSLPGLNSNSICFALAKALFESGSRPEFGFIEPDGLKKFPPNPDDTKLLVLVNQRMITSSAAISLKSFVAAGGSLLLLGSNGVFDAGGNRNPDTLRDLSSGLIDDKIEYFYEWGISGPLRLPVLAISSEAVVYDEIRIPGDPFENYRTIRNALIPKISLPENCHMEFEVYFPRHAD